MTHVYIIGIVFFMQPGCYLLHTVIYSLWPSFHCTRHMPPFALLRRTYLYFATSPVIYNSMIFSFPSLQISVPYRFFIHLWTPYSYSFLAFLHPSKLSNNWENRVDSATNDRANGMKQLRQSLSGFSFFVSGYSFVGFLLGTSSAGRRWFHLRR